MITALSDEKGIRCLHALRRCGVIVIGDIDCPKLGFSTKDRRMRPTVRLEEQGRAGEGNKRGHLPNDKSSVVPT